MTTFEIPGAIPKADIAYWAARCGCVFALPMFIDGRKYPAGHVRYVNSSRALDRATGLYAGVCRIEILAEPEDPTPGFESLPGVYVENPTDVEDGGENESEVTDVDG